MIAAPRSTRRVLRRAVVVLLLAAAFGLTSTTAVYGAAEVTTSISSGTTVSTPTTHSYDDSDSEKDPEGASPALWILGGAVAGLVAIAVILIRAGGSPRHHSH